MVSPDTPMVQYRAQFLIHIPLSVLNFSMINAGKFCPILIYVAGNFNFLPVIVLAPMGHWCFCYFLPENSSVLRL